MTLRDALLIALDLAEQNLIDEREEPREYKIQCRALRIVTKLRNAVPPSSDDEYKSR